VLRNHRLAAIIRLQVNKREVRRKSLVDLFDELFGPGRSDEISDTNCEQCNTRSTHRASDRLGRLPDTLWVALDRGDPNPEALNIKINTVITFPERVDLSPFFDGTGLSNNDADRGFNSPFMYDIVSVIVHSGATIRGGHYINYSRVANVQQGRERWHRFDDSTTSEATFQETQNGTATYLCLQRVGR